jgi:hypothetical protein
VLLCGALVLRIRLRNRMHRRCLRVQLNIPAGARSPMRQQISSTGCRLLPGQAQRSLLLSAVAEPSTTTLVTLLAGAVVCGANVVARFRPRNPTHASSTPSTVGRRQELSLRCDGGNGDRSDENCGRSPSPRSANYCRDRLRDKRRQVDLSRLRPQLGN